MPRLRHGLVVGALCRRTARWCVADAGRLRAAEPPPPHRLPGPTKRRILLSFSLLCRLTRCGADPGWDGFCAARGPPRLFALPPTHHHLFSSYRTPHAPRAHRPADLSCERNIPPQHFGQLDGHPSPNARCATRTAAFTTISRQAAGSYNAHLLRDGTNCLCAAMDYLTLFLPVDAAEPLPASRLPLRTTTPTFGRRVERGYAGRTTCSRSSAQPW